MTLLVEVDSGRAQSIRMGAGAAGRVLVDATASSSLLWPRGALCVGARGRGVCGGLGGGVRVRPGCASVLDQHGDRVSGEHRRSVAIDNPGGSTGMGMMAGSGPSVAPLPGFGSNHEIASQANDLDHRSRGPRAHSVWVDGGYQPEHRRCRDRAGERPAISGQPDSLAVIVLWR